MTEGAITFTGVDYTVKNGATQYVYIGVKVNSIGTADDGTATASTTVEFRAENDDTEAQGVSSNDDIVVDVMATSSDVLGFTNRWYSEGFLHLIDKDLGGHCSVKILQSPYFIATKMEAFKNRGGGDGRMSSDFEDIVYVLNNRKSVWNELSDATDSVKSYLKDEFAQLLMSDVLFEWVGAHLEYSEQERVGVILSSIEKFIGNEFLGEHVSIHTQ
jgi:hypothetical protein